VASRHELRDELSAENARGASYEDLHDCSSGLICPFWGSTRTKICSTEMVGGAIALDDKR
jgi:hypothetical protein